MAIFTPTTTPHNVNAFFSRGKVPFRCPRHLLSTYQYFQVLDASTYPLNSSSNIGYTLHKQIRKNGGIRSRDDSQKFQKSTKFLQKTNKSVFQENQRSRPRRTLVQQRTQQVGWGELSPPQNSLSPPHNFFAFMEKRTFFMFGHLM